MSYGLCARPSPVAFGFQDGVDEDCVRPALRDEEFPAGYCYLAAVRPEFRAYAAKMGKGPTLDWLFTLPARWFQDVSVLADLAVHPSASIGCCHLSFESAFDTCSFLALCRKSVVQEYGAGTLGRLVAAAEVSVAGLAPVPWLRVGGKYARRYEYSGAVAEKISAGNGVVATEQPLTVPGGAPVQQTLSGAVAEGGVEASLSVLDASCPSPSLPVEGSEVLAVNIGKDGGRDDFPDGYCYLGAVRPEYRDEAAALGEAPALSALLELPAHYFLDLLDLTRLAVVQKKGQRVFHLERRERSVVCSFYAVCREASYGMYCNEGSFAALVGDEFFEGAEPWVGDLKLGGFSSRGQPPGGVDSSALVDATGVIQLRGLSKEEAVGLKTYALPRVRGWPCDVVVAADRSARARWWFPVPSVGVGDVCETMLKMRFAAGVPDRVVLVGFPVLTPFSVRSCVHLRDWTFGLRMLPRFPSVLLTETLTSAEVGFGEMLETLGIVPRSGGRAWTEVRVRVPRESTVRVQGEVQERVEQIGRVAAGGARGVYRGSGRYGGGGSPGVDAPG